MKSGRLNRSSELRPNLEKVREFNDRARASSVASLDRSRRRPKPPISKAERSLALIFWDEAMRQGRCAVCGHSHYLQAHHVVPMELLRRKLRHLAPERLIGIFWDPRNALALCADPAPNRCHDRHTLSFKRVPKRALRPCVYEFAREIDALAAGEGSEPFSLYLDEAYPEAA